jgi:hypothetical protein
MARIKDRTNRPPQNGTLEEYLGHSGVEQKNLEPFANETSPMTDAVEGLLQ